MLKKLIACTIAAFCFMGTAYVPSKHQISANCITFLHEGDITYFVENGVAEIFSLDPSYSGALVIPETLGGYPVARIGKTAFSECSKLTSLTLPKTLEFIGEYAFYSCTALKTVTIPNMTCTDVHLGDYAFFECSALEEIKFPKTGFKYVSKACFYSCTAMKSAELPANVNKICDYAFFNCRSLETLTIYSPFCDIPLDPMLVCTSYGPDSYPFAGTICGLPNSTAEYYAEWCGLACNEERKFQQLYYPDFPLGDADLNWKVDSADASEILAEYARRSTGEEATFTVKQYMTADTDENGEINAADASKVLAFYAYRSTGGIIEDMKIWSTWHPSK